MEASGARLFLHPVIPKKKSKPTVSTSALYKKTTPPLPPSVNLPDAKRRRDKPTKYDSTSRPHGIRKRVLKNNAVRKWQKAELEKTQSPQRSSLSSDFDETTSGVRKSILSQAEALLHEAQSSLLGRIEGTYGTKTSPRKQEQKEQQPTQPAKLAKPSKGPYLDSSSPPEQAGEDAAAAAAADPGREPTSAEACGAHNALISRLNQPLADEPVPREAVPRQQGQPTADTTLGAAMAAFRATVAAEEKHMAGLEAEWERVQDEVRALARGIVFGSLTREEWAAGLKPPRGVGADVVEALRREVVGVADEFEGAVAEMRSAERELKKRQERYLAQTIRVIGEL